jgi:hypothetical protein
VILRRKLAVVPILSSFQKSSEGSWLQAMCNYTFRRGDCMRSNRVLA